MPDTHADDPRRPLPRAVMLVLAVAVGIIAGFGAVVFREMIGLVHNLMFLGQLSTQYDANVHTPVNPWGAWVILVPVVGSLVVTFLIVNFAPEAKGHGVPEVMDAIYYHKGRIRPIVAVIKSVASAISIGTGGSVGREGPIIQIGAAFGSTLGQILPMPAHQRITLIAAGAAGGIAATFNTPIGGVVFAIELMLPAVSAATLAPVVISTICATYIGRAVLGLQPAFYIPSLQSADWSLLNPLAYLHFVWFGLAVGLAATAFVRGIYLFEDLFNRIRVSQYLRHMLGTLGVGITFYLFMRFAGHYYVQGVGYATVEDILRGALTAPLLLLLLAVAKYLVTCLTLGSGASGGVFSPCMFMGATLGGCAGVIVNRLFPNLGIPPTAFAIAGMAGMIGGSTGAVLTAVIMLFEMTRDYTIVMPVILTVALAYLVRKSLSKPSIYTLKLFRRGRVLPEGLQAAVQSAHSARSTMSTNIKVVDASDPVEPIRGKHPPLVAVRRDGCIVGVIPEPPAEAQPGARWGDQPTHPFILVHQGIDLIDVMSQLHLNDVHHALVTEATPEATPQKIIGVISDVQIAAITHRAATLMG